MSEALKEIDPRHHRFLALRLGSPLSPPLSRYSTKVVAATINEKLIENQTDSSSSASSTEIWSEDIENVSAPYCRICLKCDGDEDDELISPYMCKGTHPRTVPSLVETGARLFVIRFLGHFISTGCVILLEEGGTMFTFEGTSKKCSLKTVIKVHNPHFYCKGWWMPLLFTTGLTSAKHFFKHVLRQNTLTQARRNISRHYDLSNDLFALFLDETMTYYCAVFKIEDEYLKDAQHRKISLLIEKARIDSKHEILKIGCGWGSLAIEHSRFFRIPHMIFIAKLLGSRSLPLLIQALVDHISDKHEDDEQMYANLKENNHQLQVVARR
ncbi:hypothetical protein REPUB_Repub20aG0041600 [Reevesia pubescens]